MKIEVDKLSSGSNVIDKIVTAEQLTLDKDQYPEDIHVHLEIDKIEGKISVQLDASTMGHLICHRCGDEFERVLRGKCAVNFVRRNEAFPEEMPGDDLRSFLPGQSELNILTEAVDAVELSFPPKILCREDCKGICFGCRKNLNKEECTCPVEG
ncbi:DUF177 domain-containing protein [Calditrichota bacterium]